MKRECCKPMKKLIWGGELPVTHEDIVGLALKGSLEHLECYLMFFPSDLGTLESQRKFNRFLGNDLFRNSMLSGKSAELEF